MDDAAVLVSLLLQMGAKAGELVGRLGTAGDGGPSSPIGAVARLVDALEGDCAPAVRMAYQAVGVGP